MKKNLLKTTVIALSLLSAGSLAVAQGIPVYDNTSYLQGFKQLTQTIEQLKTMNAQLDQMKEQIKRTTGNRGKELLLSDQNRHYLPQDWSSVSSLVDSGASQAGAMSQQINSAVGQNAVVTDVALQSLDPALRTLIMKARKAAATQHVLSVTAYNNASKNVNQLQQLTNAITPSTDPKDIQDLQARIATEQSMLQNDAIKLAQATQIQQAEERILKQQQTEHMMGVGGESLDKSSVKIRAK